MEQAINIPIRSPIINVFVGYSRNRLKIGRNYQSFMFFGEIVFFGEKREMDLLSEREGTIPLRQV